MKPTLYYYKGTVSYDGTDYSGWQLQKTHPSIQGEIERVLRKIFDVEIIRLHGASRTDAGVHSHGQTFNFKTAKLIQPDKLQLGMNSLLPMAIFVNSLEMTDSSFHSRFMAQGKHYVYRFAFPPDPLKIRYAYALLIPPDFAKMEEAAPLFEGTHDFSGFRNLGKDKSENTICTIHQCRLLQMNGMYELHIKGDRFLYNMIRIMAGTLLYIGYGKLFASDITDTFETLDRSKIGKTLTPNGLTLEKVYYKPFKE